MIMVKNGVDVSAWKEKIDWDKAGAKVDFVIVRLGFGKNNPDKWAERNISELNRLGIPYGVYWFSYAYTVEMARNEAKYAAQRLKEYGAKLSYPVYFDYEYDSDNFAKKNGVKVGKALLCEMATAFCEEVKAAGYFPGIYANPDYIEGHYGEEIFKKYDLWLAQYSATKSRDVNIWQYSSSGKVPGISGGVDMNRCYFDYPAAICKADAEEPTAPEAEKAEEKEGYAVSLRTLKRNCKGEDVRALQILLAGRGYNGKMNKPDGKFGPNTEGAVKLFQKAKGLDVDGIAWIETMSKLLGVE